jgi:glycosyltransferase involved in cell wall biosynthesis
MRVRIPTSWLAGPALEHREPPGCARAEPMRQDGLGADVLPLARAEHLLDVRLEAQPAIQAPASMHVAYLINTYPMVSLSFIRREIRAMERQGVTVDRLALRGWDEKVVDPDDEVERARTQYVLRHGIGPLTMAVLRTAARRPRQFLSSLATAIGMSRHADRGLIYHLVYFAHACMVREWVARSGATHLHAHFGTNAAEVAMIVRLLGGPPYSFTVHGSEEFDKGETLGLDKKMANAKFIVAVNSFCRAQMFRRSAIADWGKIKIVHCGLDDTFLSAPPREAPDVRRFVSIGRFCKEKGQIVLLEAFSQVLKRYPDCQLVLGGDGEMRQEVEERIRTLGISESVRVTGWLSNEQVRDEILAARSLVLPSFQESLPIVIMEAMACRRPVIATYVGGMAELVEPGATGWLVQTGNVEELEAAMLANLAMPIEDLRSLGEAGAARVRARHVADSEVSKLVKLFQAQQVVQAIEQWLC